ncbi:hypothetical protein PIIN_07131 [Serendipita indica DSM 11827]|uniref:Uncharacterized protein n=1 Tax=Serendipita indica (strain DSM 11827) TaxID=1109443 RepID=G4TPD4_SERID|nr:hypothetical protein PIIN_07131 [Serendipita indica DSM 11827]
MAVVCEERVRVAKGMGWRALPPESPSTLASVHLRNQSGGLVDGGHLIEVEYETYELALTENDGFIRAHFVRRQAKLIRHKAYGQDSPLCVHGYSVEPRSVSPVGACHIAFADRRGALFA